MARYAVYICGPSPCPVDPAFEHDGYYGCVPKNFSTTTGRSRTHRQTKVEHLSLTPTGYRYLWNGGCDAARRAALESPPEPEGTAQGDSVGSGDNP